MFRHCYPYKVETVLTYNKNQLVLVLSNVKFFLFLRKQSDLFFNIRLSGEELSSCTLCFTVAIRQLGDRQHNCFQEMFVLKFKCEALPQLELLPKEEIIIGEETNASLRGSSIIPPSNEPLLIVEPMLLWSSGCFLLHSCFPFPVFHLSGQGSQICLWEGGVSPAVSEDRVFLQCLGGRWALSTCRALQILFVLFPCLAPGTSRCRPHILWDLMTLWGWRLNPTSAGRGGLSPTASPLP